MLELRASFQNLATGLTQLAAHVVSRPPRGLHRYCSNAVIWEITDLAYFIFYRHREQGRPLRALARERRDLERESAAVRAGPQKHQARPSPGPLSRVPEIGASCGLF
jgi:hypothetical protein